MHFTNKAVYWHRSHSAGCSLPCKQMYLTIVIIRIFHECEVRIEKSARGSLFGIMRLCQVMPNSDPEGQIFLYAPKTKIDSFSSYLWSAAFDFDVGVAINESVYIRWRPPWLKFDVICDVAMTSTPNVLTTELHDLLYNQCIGNMCCYSSFIYSTGRIRVCKIRFVSTGENRGKPCLVGLGINQFFRYNICIDTKWSIFDISFDIFSNIKLTFRSLIWQW